MQRLQSKSLVVCCFEPRGNKLFGGMSREMLRDSSKFCGAPKKLENKKFVFKFLAPIPPQTEFSEGLQKRFPKARPREVLLFGALPPLLVVPR